MKRRKIVLLWGLLSILLSACDAITLAAPTPMPTPDRLTLIPPLNEKFTLEEDPAPPILHAEGWQNPVPAPGLLNSTGLEDSPFVTPDGSRMLFFFTPTIENPPEMQVLDGVSGLYFSDWEGAGWGAPLRVILTKPGKYALDGCGTLHEDVLWFCSVREGNLREIDIWTATRSEKGWEVENAGERLNLELMVGEMHLSTDGNLMFYHTDSLPGQGGLDIWQIRRQGEGWSEPEIVTAVNTPGDDGWPFLSEDGQELWFTRTYQGSPAVFRSGWDGSAWGTPELIVSQFAGEPTLDQSGNLYFVHHVLIDGVIRDADIYVAYVTP